MYQQNEIDMTNLTTEQIENAKVKYQNGWILELPKNGLAPMLFLEWISEFRSGLMPIQKVIDGDAFQIRFNLTKKEIEKCVEYINNNI